MYDSLTATERETRERAGEIVSDRRRYRPTTEGAGEAVSDQRRYRPTTEGAGEAVSDRRRYTGGGGREGGVGEGGESEVGLPRINSWLEESFGGRGIIGVSSRRRGERLTSLAGLSQPLRQSRI